MGRAGSAILATAYVLASAGLLYLFAVDREAQGEFDDRAAGPYDLLLALQPIASIAVGALIGRRWVLALPLLVLASGWVAAYSVAAGHAFADVLINSTVLAVADLVTIAIGLMLRRLARRRHPE